MKSVSGKKRDAWFLTHSRPYTCKLFLTLNHCLAVMGRLIEFFVYLRKLD